MPDEHTLTKDESLPEVAGEASAATPQRPTPEQPAVASADERDPQDPPATMELLEVEPGRYDMGDEVARGGLGRILAAHDRRLDRPVVVKLALRDGAAPRLVREARVTARLQHPGIVPVHDAARLPTGEPFFAMKRLEGRSLQEVVAEAATLRARLALLPTLIAVADAVAYAHSQGVVHRDLKPANVIVGAFGETVVIDWGLAKRTGSTNRRSPQPAPPVDEPELTRAGQIMGTPAYMAPEQAWGAIVDERADVYALGGMLYHLLTGKAPHARSADDGERAPPLPLLEAQPETPPELAAIVAKAMVEDKWGRYASAAELAEDLKRFQTGKLVSVHAYSLGELLRRWIRRYRAPLAVAAAAVVALAALGMVAVTRIVAERDRADAQRGAAEELVDFMLVDLRRRLRHVGKLDVLDGVAQKVERYYRRTKDERVALDAEALRRQAQAFALLDAVRTTQGDRAAALAARSEKIANYRRAVALEPGSEAYALDLAEAIAELTADCVEEGDVQAARTAGQETLALIDAREPTSATPSRWRRLRAKVLGDFGKLEVERGERSKGINLLEQARAIQETLQALDPDDEDLAMDAHFTLGLLAGLLSNAGSNDEALARASAADKLASRFAARDQSDLEWQTMAANGKRRMALTLASMGRTSEAIGWYQQAREIRERLTARDPTDLTWLGDLGLTLAELAWAQHLEGADAEARGNIQRALGLIERVAMSDRAGVHWQASRYVALMYAAQIDGAERPRDSLFWSLRACSLLDELLAGDPNNGEYKERLALCHGFAAESELRIGNMLADARKHLAAAIRSNDEIVKRDPGVPANQWNLACARWLLADVLSEDDQREAALDELREALKIADEAAAKMAGMTDVQLDLADHHVTFGRRLIAVRGDRDGARASFERARGILKGLEAENRLPAEKQKALKDVEALLAKP